MRKEVSRYALICMAIFLLWLISFVTPCFSLIINLKPVGPDGKTTVGNNWLLIIGINNYQHWPKLKAAEIDAKTVRNILLERYHFSRNHIIELYNEQCTEKNIITKLRFLARSTKEDDSLLVFYAGHGYFDKITKTGYWIPVEGDMDDPSSWISNRTIKSYLRVDAIKAKHILLISDSCFAGDFFRGISGSFPKITDKTINKAYRLPSRQAITSGGDEPVSDDGFGGHSVFAHFLLLALKQNRKPYLVPTELFQDLRTNVATNAKQLPEYGCLHSTGGDQGGEYVLFLRQKHVKDIKVVW